MATLRPRVARWILFVGLAIMAGRLLAALPAPAKEVKAVFVHNFAQFVRWPLHARPSKESPFVIGVQGDPDMLRILGKLAEGQRVGDQPLVVRDVKDFEDLRACQILFVAPGSEALVRRLSGANAILTVGETDAFVAAGGIIRLLNDRNKIKVQVNLAAAAAAGLEVSSQLLRVAEVIGGRK